MVLEGFMRKIQVTDNFIEYSKELAQNILGYNQCVFGGGDKEIKRKLRNHIKKCENYLNREITSSD